MARVKSKVVRSTLDNKDVMEMFQGALGTGEGTDLSLKIVYPKYIKIKNHCERYLRLLSALHDSALMSRFPAEEVALEEYVSALRVEAETLFSAPDLAALHPPSTEGLMMGWPAEYSEVTRAEYDAFASAYARIKDSNLVQTIIVTCKNLLPHKKSIEKMDALRGRFLTKSGGLTFAPFQGLPAVNIKRIFSGNTTEDDKSFILVVLHKTYVISHDVYDAVSAPDIDVDEFVNIIIGSLDDVKKQIPRCNEAFDKIRDSVGLLKGNFDGYYKDFVASNNPTIIMENFVLDVSTSTESSPKVTAQFRRIISHYRSIASQQATTPQMQGLFAQVDKNFQELERQSRGAGADEDEDEDEDEDDAGAAAAAAPADSAAELADARRTVEAHLAASGPEGSARDEPGLADVLGKGETP